MAIKKPRKKQSKRSCELTVDAFAHRVYVRWWDIKGPVTDEELHRHADEHIRDELVEDNSSGQLYFDDGKSTATGWWDTKQQEVTPEPRAPGTLSLLDKFAIGALEGLLASENPMDPAYTNITAEAYRHARDMLTARNAPENIPLHTEP